MNTIKKVFLYAFAMLLCEGCDNGNSHIIIEDNYAYSLVKRASQLEEDYENYFYYRVNSLPIEANPFLFIQVHIEGDNGEYLYLDDVTDSIDTDTKGVVKIYPKPNANVSKIIAAIQRAQQWMKVEEITGNPKYILCTLPQISETLKADLENSIETFYEYFLKGMYEIYTTYIDLITFHAEPNQKEELICECKNEYHIKKEEVTSYKNEILQTIESATNPNLQLNKDVQDELAKYEKKIIGFRDLFIYRCACIPTKTNIMQLLPIVVTVDGQDKNIEDVADCSIESDEYFKIVPKQEDYREAIKVGILQSHPYMRVEDKMDEPPVYIRCAMPEVNKDLRDTFNKLLLAFYNDAKSKINLSKSTFMPKLIELLATHHFKDFKEAKGIADDIYDTGMKKVETKNAEKKKEIADAYQRYCTTHGLTPETPVVVYNSDMD